MNILSILYQKGNKYFMMASDIIRFYIIIPVYNMEKYLSRCVESILKQSYNNWHMVLVDDGSTDESGRMIDDFSATDSRITAIHKENGGIASAMKAALANIDGDFVIFIDSDDYIENNMLSILSQVIGKENADIVQFAMRKVDEDNNEIDFNQSEIQIIYGAENILRTYFEKIKMPSLAMRIFRKELFQNIQLVGKSVGVDESTILQLFGNCNKLVSIDVPLYNVFVRKDSVSRSSVTVGFIRECLEQYEFMSKYIEDYFISLKGYMLLKYLNILIFIETEGKSNSLGHLIDLNRIHQNYKKSFHFLKKEKAFQKEPLHFRIGAYLFYFSPGLYYYIKKIKGDIHVRLDTFSKALYRAKRRNDACP